MNQLRQSSAFAASSPTLNRLRNILNRDLAARVVFICVIATAATWAQADVLTFTELHSLGSDKPVPQNYQPVGLPPGIVTTFGSHDGNFSSDIFPDHTYGIDETRATELYGPNFNDSIFFSGGPVIVPSLYATQSSGPAGFTIEGRLNAITQWTATGFATYDPSNPQATFTQITAGIGIPIDSLFFTNYADNLLDDITVNSVPEPSGIVLVALSLIGSAAWGWRGKRRRASA
jgi:hypothetical protein